MVKLLKVVGAIISIVTFCYSIVYMSCYADDNITCRRAGWTNSFTNYKLEGYCSKQVAPNNTVTTRVERAFQTRFSRVRVDIHRKR